MFNIIPITAANMYPLSAYYPYDSSIQINSTYEKYNNGYNGVVSDIFNSTTDVAFGKNTTFYITSSINLFDFITETSISIGIFDLNLYAALKAYNNLYVTDSSNYAYASATSVTENEFFRFTKNADNTICIIDYEGKYATVSRYAPFNLSFEYQYLNDMYNQQKFNYFFRDDKICFVTLYTNPYPQYGPAITKNFLSYSPINKQVRSVGVFEDDDYVAHNEYYFTLSNVYLSSIDTGFNADVKWIKYYNNYNTIINNKNTEIQQEISGIKLNYLVDYEYKKGFTVDTYGTDNVARMSINMAELKNIQTPEYEYTTAPTIINNVLLSATNTSESIVRRNYNNIFIGSNQEDGYENPFLSYTSNSKEMTLPCSKLTYFHYPCASQQIPLSSAGFIESGAIAGASPIRSDKIWKKMANYSKDIYWGDSLQWQRGVYLCSWLSGNYTGDAVWKDRWYNPGYITFTQAATTIDIGYILNNPSIIDENTQMTFDPGVYYSYLHFGERENSTIINTLTGDGTALRLYYETWTNTVSDNSKMSNNGTLNNYSNYNKSYLELDGINQECFVSYTTSLNLNDFTASIWIKSDDWSKTKSCSIVGNEFRGGWGICHSIGLNNPYNIACDSTYGHIMFSNVIDKVYLDKILPPYSSNPETPPYSIPVSVAVNSNLYSYIADNTFRKIYMVDLNGDILKEYDFSDTVTPTTIKGISIDSNNIINVLGTDIMNSYLYKLNQNLELVSYTSYGTVYNCIEIDLNDVVVLSEATKVVIDTNNNIWSLSAGMLYKDTTTSISPTAFIFSGDIIDLACDRDDNIWTVNDTNKFYKFDNTGSFVLSGTVNTDNDATSGRYIKIGDQYDNYEHKDYVYILESYDNTLYKYDSNATYVTKTVLTENIDINNYITHDKNIMKFKFVGDCNGYDWNRKFKYAKNNKTPYIEAKVHLGSLLSNEQTISLTFPVSDMLTNDWMQLSLSYNSSIGESKLYLNGFVKDTSLVGASSVYYEYENPIIIGGSAGRSTNLDNEFGVKYYHYNGLVDTVRIYDWALNIFDSIHLYNEKAVYEDLVWNMPIGSYNFIEEIERFFKNKLPGSKSMYYNIRIVGLGITNTTTRSLIEEIVRDTVKKISPAYTNLYKIIWE